ncbi:MAG: hypothetical protein GY854_24095 [Deltaproteobacteria bacterium]|nr:hypothetical protein [Deltaproteobacteria bacterium]
MMKLVTAIIATILVVAFAISNSHHVQLSFGFGTPVNIRLVFLLLSTFFLGMTVPVFARLFHNLKRKNQLPKTTPASATMVKDLVEE